VPDSEGGKRLDLDPEAAEILRNVVERVTGGITLSHEVERLNDSPNLSPADYRQAKAGTWHPPMARSQWTYSALYQHLRSAVLRGHRVEGKRANRRSVRDADGAPVMVGTPLLSDAEWYALQEQLDTAGSSPRRPRRKSTLLLHVAQCGMCTEDRTLYYNAREYRGERRDLYTCAAARSATVRKAGPCPGVTISAKKLEEMVSAWFLAEWGPQQVLSSVRIGGADHTAEIRDLEADLAELGESLPGLRGPALALVLTQLQGRSDRIEELRAAPVEPERWELVPTGQTVAQAWEDGDTATRRLMLMDYRIKATVAPANGARKWDAGRVSVGRDITHLDGLFPEHRLALV
jgi:hypothetical protein